MPRPPNQSNTLTPKTKPNEKSIKWSEQSLIEQTFVHNDSDGQTVTRTLRCLDVCISGKELYRREFIDGKYKGKNELRIPYDFIVMIGSMGAPDGRYYEMEYTIGEYSIVYRALIQAAKPVEDLPLIIAVLKQKNLLPADLTPMRAWLRGDIDAVRIGHCSKEDGEAVFYSGHVEAKDSDESLASRATKYANLGVSIDYYRGDCREVFLPAQCDCSKEKVFVCGVNGDDPAFAQQRAEDVAQALADIENAVEILSDYGIDHFMLVPTPPDEADPDAVINYDIYSNITVAKMDFIIQQMIANKNKQSQK